MFGRILNPHDSSKGNLLISEEDFLGDMSIEWGLMEVPALSLTLPSSYAKYLSGNTNIRIASDGWVYEGYVETKTLDLTSHTVNIKTAHVINKLNKRTMPTNITLKNLSVREVIEHTWKAWLEDESFYDIVSQFKFKYVDSYAEQYKMEYEFSNETLTEFLVKVCEKSPDLYWRINRRDPYQIDIGVFGSRENILINEDNYLISVNDVVEDYSEVTNVSVVMSDKADGGASSLTLRDIFYNKHLFVAGFPVIKTGNKVNSQRHYQYPQIPQFAPEIIGDEFALMDEEGIAMESGELYWGTFVENDTQAIAEDNEAITNQDRIRATQQLYQSAIRKLKNSRRKIIFDITVSPVEKHFHIGDKVMFKIEEGVWELTSCGRYYTKVLKESNWFYVVGITDIYEEGNAYTQRLQLSKYPYSVRDITVTT